jgi:C-terminal processing protease CtpA/Prc
MPEGNCIIPIGSRFVENRAVITAVFTDGLAVERGDVITGIDRASLSELIEQLRPYYGASNDAAALRDIAFNMTRGVCGEAELRVQHNGEEKTVDVSRVPINGIRARWIDSGQSHELAGPAFRKLSNTTSYLKVSALKMANVREYVGAARATKGLILDMRGAVSEPIMGYLLDIVHPTFFSRVTAGDLSNPGAFEWEPQPLGREAARSPLKIVVLIDELTQSYLEFGTMALRSVPGVLIVGSTTAGADGNVSEVVLPGDLRVRISGVGIFYPDGRPTQRVGIVPDVRVTPTIAGIATGRDEVLEEAERQLEK